MVFLFLRWLMESVGVMDMELSFGFLLLIFWRISDPQRVGVLESGVFGSSEGPEHRFGYLVQILGGDGYHPGSSAAMVIPGLSPDYRFIPGLS